MTNKRKWSPEKVDIMFDGLKEKLGRTPKRDEFPIGALKMIVKERYCPGIRTWNQYLQHRSIGMNLEIGKWTPEVVDRTFDKMKKELGRKPLQDEFAVEYSGALKAISKGRYHPEIRNWNEYLAHRGEELNNDKLTPEKVDIIFDGLREKLSRTPKAREFSDKGGGVLVFINQGKYHPEVKTWNEYLVYRGIELNKKGSWAPGEIDRVFDELKEKLGRVPTSVEFPSGMLNPIREGRYHPDVNSWNEYLQHRGEKVNKPHGVKAKRSLEILENLLGDGE